MRVLVLGASGFIGGRILQQLATSGWARPVGAARKARAASGGIEWLAVDTLDAGQLSSAVAGVDAVVNSVAGSGEVIAAGAKRLAEAASAGGGRPIVHLSSMAVYGGQEGTLTEGCPFDPELGWYAKAKCEAEQHFAEYARQGHPVVVLRPGCVHGAGSDMWVGRIGRLLRARRLGDVGAAGDGWSNLIHVDDVGAAVLAGLRHTATLAGAGSPAVFNVAAPDSPRWNEYFADLAQRIGVVPVPHPSERSLKLDAKVLSPFLKIADIFARKLGRASSPLPEPLPPSLLKLWRQQIRLDVSALQDVLGVHPMPYSASLSDSADWFNRHQAGDVPGAVKAS
ncbi:MAG TPA: NAD(P)-dependent oxidoreductase [Roseateles sp.]